MDCSVFRVIVRETGMYVASGALHHRSAQVMAQSSASSQAQSAAGRAVFRVPPHAYFLVSAVFHYLGPAFAVLLFARIEVLGVAWLRIASAALVFAAWRRPWRGLGAPSPQQAPSLPPPGLTPAAPNRPPSDAA